MADSGQLTCLELLWSTMSSSRRGHIILRVRHLGFTFANQNQISKSSYLMYSLYILICQRWIRLLSRPFPHSTPLRTLTTTSRLLHPESPPPATSTSAAQPFSTPFTPSPAKTPGIPSSPSTTPKSGNKGSARPPSSVPAGTPLRGLGYIKGQEGPVAKEDSEYPDWLWGLLDGKRNESEQGTAGDAFGKLDHSIAKRGLDGRVTTTKGLPFNGIRRQNEASHSTFSLPR